MQNLNSAKSTLKDCVAKMQHSVSESITTYSSEVEHQTNTLGNASTSGEITFKIIMIQALIVRGCSSGLSQPLQESSHRGNKLYGSRGSIRVLSHPGVYCFNVKEY